MKKVNKLDYQLIAVFSIIFFIIYIVLYTAGIGNKSRTVPQLLLSGTVFMGMFFNDKVGAIFGFVAGALLDAVMADVICFNSIVLMLFGYFAGIVIKKALNNNFRTSIIVITVSTVIYFLIKWAVLGFDKYFLRYSIPYSIFLTVIFSLPLYAIMYYFIKKRKDKKFSK